MYETTADFYWQTRVLFPELSERADTEYINNWGKSQEDANEYYVWFGAVATALNNEMCRRSYLRESAAFFDYVNVVLAGCGEVVRSCIDVSLVENLFWQVPLASAGPCWNALPSPLQELYLEFHRKPPV